MVDTNSNQPIILSRVKHKISRHDISQSALNVLANLNKAGFEAYLVGGGVRDLLLNRHPKDFDIATNALPEEIKAIFPNCRLIGRRFRLAHVYFGYGRHSVVEVATFRRGLDNTENSEHQSQSEDGMLLRDNIYGSMLEDAYRRDFTVNSLYYNLADQSVIDYTQGLSDLDARVLRIIGEPEARYREDPVRMLRAIRLMSKLDFTLSAETEAPLLELGVLLRNVPSARLFEEYNKLFLNGYALATFQQLCHYQLLQFMFPLTVAMLQSVGNSMLMLIEQALLNTDTRVNEDKPVTPAFLLAVFLWHPYQAELKKIGKSIRTAPHFVAFESVLEKQREFIAIPKRFAYAIQDIIFLQPRLCQRHPKKIYRLMKHRRFRAAYDFLVLRAEAGESELVPIANWWTEFQEASDNQHKVMVKALMKSKKTSKTNTKKTTPKTTENINNKE